MFLDKEGVSRPYLIARMDDEEAYHDGPNIRPPQYHANDRDRSRHSKRERQVFLPSRRDDRPPKSSNSQRRDSDGRRGADLRDRISGNRDRGGKDYRKGGRRDSDPRRSHHRQSHRDDRNQCHRDERDARVQRILSATIAKTDSRRDVEEKRRQRMMKEREAQEAEMRIKRKRERSEERQSEVKKSRGGSRSGAGSPVQQSEESGEDDTEEGESDSSNGSSDSEADTASGASATPDRDDDSNAEEEDENASETEGEESEESDAKDLEDKEAIEKNKKKNESDHSRTPSRSPTPRRKSSGDEHSDAKDETEIEARETEMEDPTKGQSAEFASPVHDVRDDLPPYLPSIFGCRSVDEFHVSKWCTNAKCKNEKLYSHRTRIRNYLVKSAI